jgi:hypothetical protein
MSVLKGRIDTMSNYESEVKGYLGFICVDCHLDTSPVGLDEYYMVHDEVWAQSGMGGNDGMLCLFCLEARLGRTLEWTDFTDIPMNDIFVEAYL